MNDNYRIKCNLNSSNLINVINLKGEISLDNNEYILSTDSRCIKKNDIFIALKGDYSDGHQFLSQAFNNGATSIVIGRSITKGNIKKNIQKLIRTLH